MMVIMKAVVMIIAVVIFDDGDEGSGDDDDSDEGSGDDYDGDEGDINNTSDGEI